MSGPLLHLAAVADDRKARLAQLRAVKRKQPDDDGAEPGAVPAAIADPGDVSRTYLSGRNYDPDTRGPKLGYDAPPTLAGLTLEQQAAEIEDEVRQRTAAAATDPGGLDLLRLQPKKANWYLRRHLDQRLEVLNVRTDNAITKLVRDRIAAEQVQKKAAVKQSSSAEPAHAALEHRSDLEAAPGDDDAPVMAAVAPGQPENRPLETEADGLDGVALVEGLRVREQEEAEEVRREREAEAEDQEDIDMDVDDRESLHD